MAAPGDRPGLGGRGPGSLRRQRQHLQPGPDPPGRSWSAGPGSPPRRRERRRRAPHPPSPRPAAPAHGRHARRCPHAGARPSPACSPPSRSSTAASASATPPTSMEVTIDSRPVGVPGAGPGRSTCASSIATRPPRSCPSCSTASAEPSRGAEPGRGGVGGLPARTARPGATAPAGMFVAVCDDGYVPYRAYDADIMRAEYPTVVIEELRGRTPDVEAALWRFVFDLDLVGEVTAKRRPVDEPLRWRLADPRQLKVDVVRDRLYLRVLDVPAAFESRGYRRAGRARPRRPAAGDRPRAGPTRRRAAGCSRRGRTGRPAGRPDRGGRRPAAGRDRARRALSGRRGRLRRSPPPVGWRRCAPGASTGPTPCWPPRRRR